MNIASAWWGRSARLGTSGMQAQGEVVQWKASHQQPTPDTLCRMSEQSDLGNGKSKA